MLEGVQLDTLDIQRAEISREVSSLHTDVAIIRGNVERFSGINYQEFYARKVLMEYAETPFETGRDNNFIAYNVKELVLQRLIKTPSSWTSSLFGGVNSTLKKISFGEVFTAIPGYYVDYCSTLESVELPTSLTTLYARAFFNCKALKQISLPEGLTVIGDRAFSNSGLESLELPRSVRRIGKESFDNCPIRGEVRINPDLPEIGYGAFSRCECMDRFIIEDSENPLIIDSYTFPSQMDYLYIGRKLTPLPTTSNDFINRSTRVNDVEFSSEFDILPSQYVRHNPYIRKVILPQNCTQIGAQAFLGCTALADCALPAGITSIGDLAFSSCILREVVFPEGLKYIGESAYYNNKIESLQLPESLESIGSMAFSHCGQLGGEVRIPRYVTSMGSQAFADCPGINRFIIENSEEMLETCYSAIPSNCDYIYLGRRMKGSNGNQSFIEKNNTCQHIEIGPSFYTIEAALLSCNPYVQQITLPETITKVGSGGFRECTSLSEINLPSSLKELGYLSFFKCSSLNRVPLPASLEKIEDYAFENTPLSDVNSMAAVPPEVRSKTFTQTHYENVLLTVPAGSVGKYRKADYWKNFFYIDSGAEFTVSVNVQGASITINGKEVETCSVPDGSEVIVGVTPEEGYILDSVSVNGEDAMSLFDGSGLRFPDVDQNISVEIRYIPYVPEPEIHKIEVTYDNTRGKVTLNGKDTSSLRVAQGEELILEAAPFSGYYLNTIKIDGENAEHSNGVIVIPSVTRSHSISVDFDMEISGTKTIEGEDWMAIRERTIITTGIKENSIVIISDISGRTLYCSKPGEYTVPSAGVYLVRYGKQSGKVFIR